jgi:hypothetical protein
MPQSVSVIVFDAVTLSLARPAFDDGEWRSGLATTTRHVGQFEAGNDIPGQHSSDSHISNVATVQLMS